MHRTIGFISKRLVQVREGEGRKVLLTFLYFLLVITAYYVIKPVSRSLVLGDLGSKMVPYIDLISAVLMGPMVAIFARMADRLEKRFLVGFTFTGVAASLVLFWVLFGLEQRWVPAAFYIWVSIFSVLVVTLFWLVANDLYHPREAKRLFGFIGSGGILGGVIGSSIAAAGAKLIGTERLVLLSAAMILGCWLVVKQLWKLVPSALHPPEETHPADAKVSGFSGIVGLLFSSRYLALLVGLVGLAKIVSTLIYYQFNPFIETMFPDQDTKTAFTGLFFGWMNAASFFVQFFFTSWILRRMGLTFALLCLPLGLMTGSIALFLVPTFWIAATMELYDGSMNYSLQQTTKEVLYLPIDRTIRYKVKPFIDMVVFRFGKGIAAIIGIVCLNFLHLEGRLLSYVTVPLIVLWIVLAVQLRRDYVSTIRGILQARAAGRRGRDAQASAQHHEHAPPLHDVAELEARLDALATGGPSHRKLTLACEAYAFDGTLPPEAKRLIEALGAYEQGLHPSNEPADVPIETVREWLGDPHTPLGKRSYAVKRIVHDDGQEAVDCLLGLLTVEQDASMRQQVIRGLVKLRVRHWHGHRLDFSKRMVRREIAREAEHYTRTANVAAIYRRHATARPGEDDPILGLLVTLMEESVQHIFQLLALLYRPHDILLVYNQLREADAYVRADAIELLDNLIDPSLRWLIFPVLDEDSFLDAGKGRADHRAPKPDESRRMLQEGIWDHNRWLSVTILCMVGRLRLESLAADLDRAAQSDSPLLAAAANAAKRLKAAPAPA